jgi:hypothetical protein
VDTDVLQGYGAYIFRVRVLVRMWSGCMEKVTVGDKEGVIWWGWGVQKDPHLLQQDDVAEE